MAVFLFCAFLSGACNVISTDVHDHSALVPLANGSVLFQDNDNGLWTVSAENDPEISPWEPVWNSSGLGWAEELRVSYLTGSADGESVCCCFTVRPTADSLPFPEAVVVFDSHGENGRAVCLSMNVGSGPLFEFTKDGDFLYGVPILNCTAEASDYLAMNSDGREYRTIEMVNLATGERSSHGGYLSDGFFSSPFNDLVCCGYPPAVVYDIASEEPVLEGEVDFHPLIDRWVLPDAGLVSTSRGQILRYMDGREVLNPGGEVKIYLSLSNGEYLCEYGDSIFLCGMNWESFKPVNPVLQPELQGVELPRRSLCVQNDILYFVEGSTLFSVALER